MRIASRTYDSISIGALVIVRMKILFQEMCKIRLESDVTSGPRKMKGTDSQLTRNQDSQVLLHSSLFANLLFYSRLFKDASKMAYTAVMYFLIEYDHKKYLRFVACKTRVAPIKKQTIPCLKLLSALLVCRLMSRVIHALKSQLTPNSLHYFIDSEVVLYWIKGKHQEWNSFVQNRVKEVLQQSADGIIAI